MWTLSRTPKVDRVVVLAAGIGSRLVTRKQPPKPLQLVDGVPLLVRILRTLAGEGIREAVIVVGHKGDVIRETLAQWNDLGLVLTFVENTEYEKKNGVSVLAAKDYIREGTLLTMADHLYSGEVVKRLRQFQAPKGACTLAVDFDVPGCFDIDDATKVVVERRNIRAIAKELTDYNALDVGVFRIGPSLVAELERLYATTGDCSLSDGVRALAHQGRFFACDIGDARWIDVDTPDAMREAEKLIRTHGAELRPEPRPAAAAARATGTLAFLPNAWAWLRSMQAPRNEGLGLAAGAESAR